MGFRSAAPPMCRLLEVATFWFGFADRCIAGDDGLLAVAVLGSATGVRSAEPAIRRLLEVATFLSEFGDVCRIDGDDGLLAGWDDVDALPQRLSCMISRQVASSV
jgi:hypothetical protein